MRVKLKKRWYNIRKSQVSIFMILGIMIIILITLFYALTGTLYKDTILFHKRTLAANHERESLEKFVSFCILNITDNLLYELGGNGGTLNETDVAMHSVKSFGNDYRTLCVEIEGSKRCINRLLTLKDMEEEIKDRILSEIDDCLDFDYFEDRGYNVTSGDKNLSVSIGVEKITYLLRYRINMEKVNVDIEAREFYVTQKHPLGLMYKLVLDILNHETTEGYFDKDEWMKDNNMLFSIEKHRPYPYITYSINSNDMEKYYFNFSIELEDKASRVGRNYVYDMEYGCCYTEGNCFKNVVESTCKIKGGAYEDYSNCLCKYNFQGIENIEPLRDCGFRKDGESWCVSNNKIGGRSIKYSCHDSTTYQEECKDFKEEVCVEYSEEGLSKATCKQNRWEECTKCDTVECCENDQMRDCIWLNASYNVLEESDSKSCVPKIAPGFRFWDGNGQEVCNIGTKYAICQGTYCPEGWVFNAADICSRLGDCGINMNYNNKLTTSGYFETDPKYTPKNKSIMPVFMSLNREQESLVYSEERETINLIPALITAGLRYFDELTNKKNTVLDYSFCGLWEAPYDNQECEKCNNGLCTEYKCMSLGQECKYSEINGYPFCEKRIGTEADINILFSSEQPYEQDTIYLTGKELEGYTVKDQLPPYELIEFKINTSTPTKCKITYMPNLKFTETPPIWFGKPEFSIEHNVSLRLPESIGVPKKLYENLNISSIKELFRMIINNDERLVHYFDSNFISLVKDLNDYLRSKNDLIDLLKLSVSSLDNNTYYTFIRCSDESGNENQEPVFIRFKIDDNYNDHKTANIVDSYPKNNSEINTNFYNLTIYLDEPAECRYSSLDMSYHYMQNEFECETSRLKMSPIGYGSYECKTRTYLLNPFIRCMDRPPEIKRYSFNVAEGMNITPVYYAEIDQDIYLEENDLYNSTVIYLKDPQKIYTLNIITDTSECKIGFNNPIPENMYYMGCVNISEEEYNCSKDVVPGNYSVSISCVGDPPGTRNVNENSMQLSYYVNDRLKILSTFPEYDSVMASDLVELSIMINRNIEFNEITCGYSIVDSSLPEEYYQMYVYGTYVFQRKITLPDGTYKINFRCTDQVGNKAESFTNIIVK